MTKYFFVETHYDNADALFAREKEIHALFKCNGGRVVEIDGRWANQQIGLGAFSDLSSAAKAVAALQAAGISARMNVRRPALLTQFYYVGYRDAQAKEEDEEEEDTDEDMFLLEAFYPKSTQQSGLESRIVDVVKTNHGDLIVRWPCSDDQWNISAGFLDLADIEQAIKTLTDCGIETDCYRLAPDGQNRRPMHAAGIEANMDDSDFDDEDDDDVV